MTTNEIVAFYGNLILAQTTTNKWASWVFLALALFTLFRAALK